MSGFFKHDGTDSNRQKRERKLTAKVIAMKELAALRKTTQKKKNVNSAIGKYKMPYYVRYHERKDGVLIKTFRCGKCAGFVGADRKECARCIAKLEYERMKKSMGLSSVEMRKFVLEKKAKAKLDTAGNIKSVKPKIPKKTKDGVGIKRDVVKTKRVGVKTKKIVGFKMNMLKKITAKPYKSSKLKTDKSIQNKPSSPKNVVDSAKSQAPKIPKLKLEKQKKSVEGFKSEMTNENRPKLSKPTKLLIKTQSLVPIMPTLIKQVHDKNIAYSSQILLKKKSNSNSITEQKLNTSRGGMQEERNTTLKLKIQSKRKIDSQSDVQQKPSTSESGMKICNTENLGIKLEKLYATGGSKVEQNKSTKTGQYLEVTGTTYAPPTSLKAIGMPTVIIDTQKSIDKNTEVFNPASKMYEKEQNFESTTAADSDMMAPRNIDKENFPKSRDSFFGYLNLEQKSSHRQEECHLHPTISSDDKERGIPEILLDSDIIGRECFSGLLNSPNIEIIQEKDKNEKN